MKRWLVPDKHRDLAADRYHPGYKPTVIQPVEAVIIHYTGSTKAGATRNWLTMDDDVFVSVHFILERDGTVKQLIPLDERGAHAGGRTSKLNGKGNVNGRTIGIEIMNVGPIEENGEGELVTIGRHSKPFQGTGVSAGGKHPGLGTDYRYTMWEAYGPKQLDSLCTLMRQLADEIPALNNRKAWTGHENVDPTRKMDPGPAFPWTVVLNRVFGPDEE